VKAAVRKVVFASSGGTVYGVARSLPIAETHPLDPINAYGFSKVMVEKCLGLYQHQFGIDHTILRIANPYGERQRSGTGQGVIAAWMDAVRRKSGVEIWGDGSVVRDYVYIQDVVKALLLAVEESTGEKVINIGSGVGHSLVDVHGMLERVVGHDIPITFADRRSADAPANVLDVSLAKSALAWRPEMSLEDGLATVWRRTSQRRLSVT
jgi:UDP-glucose 4-epimerase